MSDEKLNSGHGNSGDRNSGNRNSGDRNSGNRNSGNRNSGDRNSGNRNSGHANSGHENSGHENSGHANSGHANSGHGNSGDRNSGNRNSGDRNSGNRNSGNWNSGNRNSGNRNSGDRNSGNRNSGNWNSGDWNPGFFNTTTPSTVRVFDGHDVNRDEFMKACPPWLYRPSPTTWIDEAQMGDAEKQANPSYAVAGGYLRKNDWHAEWRKAYMSASESDVQKVRDLPGFDADVFRKITGLDLSVPTRPREIVVEGVTYVAKGC